MASSSPPSSPQPATTSTTPCASPTSAPTTFNLAGAFELIASLHMDGLITDHEVSLLSALTRSQPSYILSIVQIATKRKLSNEVVLSMLRGVMSAEQNQSDCKADIMEHRTEDDKILLYFASEMRTVAEAIARSTLGTKREICLREIHWQKFRDGSPNLFIADAREITKRHTAFLASLHHPSVMFEQLSAIYALPRYRAKTLTVILPFYPTGTMERIIECGEVATASTLARMVSVTPQAATGPTRVVIFDIHTLSQQFFFTDNVHVDLTSCVPLLHTQLNNMGHRDKVTIAFPDDGAEKRFGIMFPDYPIVVCSKVRDGDRRIVTIKDGDPEGRHCVLVDDLVQTGGTLLEAAAALRHAGAASVSAFVAHAVFPEDAWKRFVNNPVLDKFWITDSVPLVAATAGRHAPFEVLSIAPVVREAILDTF